MQICINDSLFCKAIEIMPVWEISQRVEKGEIENLALRVFVDIDILHNDNDTITAIYQKLGFIVAAFTLFNNIEFQVVMTAGLQDPTDSLFKSLRDLGAKYIFERLNLWGSQVRRARSLYAVMPLP